MSPERRRRCVFHVTRELGVLERRACRVIGQADSTHRFMPGRTDAEERFRHEVVERAKGYGRYAYRRFSALLRRESWRVNHKRVERIWRQEGLKIPQKQLKRGRLWLNDGSCVRLSPTHRHHVWSCDAMDRTHDGRPMRIPTIIDEFSRESLDIVVNRKLNADDLIRCSTDLFVAHGPPEHHRPKNVKWNVGAEFSA